jgi:Protein of unknown function (DUF962)
MKAILRELAVQRWDDHRYYHHSRVNQSLHFVSASSFLCAYVLLFWYPVYATLVGWFVAMTARQSGHFFFEPKGYDHVNQATHEYKEAIKVGYNLRRKVLLYVAFVLAPLPLLVDRTYFGVFRNPDEVLHNVAMIWLALGLGGLVFRTVHLFFLRDVRTGIVWMLKILTDPFHDVKLYWKAPLALARGERIDSSLAKAVAESSPAGSGA